MGRCEATHSHPMRTEGSPLLHEDFLSYSDIRGPASPSGRWDPGPHQEAVLSGSLPQASVLIR